MSNGVINMAQPNSSYLSSFDATTINKWLIELSKRIDRLEEKVRLLNKENMIKETTCAKIKDRIEELDESNSHS